MKLALFALTMSAVICTSDATWMSFCGHSWGVAN